MNKRYPFLDLGTVNAEYADALKAAACRVIDSGRYVGGPENEAFEKELADATGTAFAIGVSNGLDALRLIFKAYIALGRLNPGDEVLVPANTYIASVLAITDSGLSPVFVEPDPTTLNLDTSLIEQAVTPHTRAILTVHLYGRACYDRAMAEAAHKHGLIIVEDNAQAIGADAEYRSPHGTTRTGSLGDAAAFSFYPTKNIGALGDAGAVTTSDPDLASAVRALANYGSTSRYHNVYEGYNCRLDPIQAAFLRAKLPHIGQECSRRRRLAHIYDTEIDNPAVLKPLMTAPDRCVWHQYVVRTAKRRQFMDYLADNGVGTDIHYAVPPHRQPCYSRYVGLELPVTDRLAAEILSLPISACTTETDAAEIAHIINAYRP